MHKNLMHSMIHYAIQNHLLMEFNYNNEGARVVEPFCMGLTTAGHIALRAFQSRGYSSSIIPEWKLFDLAKVSDVKILAESFEPTARDGYHVGDKSMKTIYMQVY